jgi:enamine deaminase RidA (YjgF/YER057c/UK114 family)
LDGEGNVVGAGDIGAQVRQTYANVEEVLSEFGASMDHIADEMWFVTDLAVVMGNIEALFGIRAEAYGGNPDVTQTLVQVAGLVMPELLIEIKCIAHL